MVAGCLPPRARDMYMSLRTLNAELIRLPDTTSNDMAGAARFHFWKNSIEKTWQYQPPRQPVCTLLSSVMSQLEEDPGRLSTITPSIRFWVSRVFQARESALANRPFPTLAAIEHRAEQTYSSILYCVLAAMSLQSIQLDHLASHIGKAAGIVASIRGIPVLAAASPATVQTPLGPQQLHRHPVVLLPLDIMSRVGVKEEDVFRAGPDARGLRDVIFEVATRANDHLITARTMLGKLRAGEDAGHSFEHEHEMGHAYDKDSGNDRAVLERGFDVLLESVSTQLYLDNLQKADFNPWLVGKSWKLPWRLWRATRSRQI